MNDGFEHLQRLGAQKIYETTHIARHNVEFILVKAFDKVNKVQFFGFLSILEREYSIDLSDLKAQYQAFDSEHKPATSDIPELLPTHDMDIKKRPWRLIIGVLFILFFIIMFYKNYTDRPDLAPKEINNTAINKAKDNLKIVPVQEIEVMPIHVEEEVLNEPSIVAEPIIKSHFKIVPKGKLWFGVIDLETMKKEQHIITRGYTLNPEKNWLLVFGHGNLKLENGDEVLDFKNQNKLWFVYENGVVTQINRREFKARNRGKNW